MHSHPNYKKKKKTKLFPRKLPNKKKKSDMMLHVHLCNKMLSVQVYQVKSAEKLVKYNKYH